MGQYMYMYLYIVCMYMLWAYVLTLWLLMPCLRLAERIKLKEWQQICLYLIVYSKAIW